MPRFWNRDSTKGLTLMEILIVVAIIALILVFLLINFKTQIDKGYDAQRKNDLTGIRKAFEEYYNDHDCYPPADILNTCGGTQLQPYLTKIPCDPSSKQPYLYVPEGNVCAGYRTCTQLRVDSDPDIGALGCNPVTGCGWGEGYNYCISSGVSVTAAGFDPMALPTPTSAPPPGGYACSPGGVCNSYGPPWIWMCPITFADPNCLNLCGPLANRCPI